MFGNLAKTEACISKINEIIEMNDLNLKQKIAHFDTYQKELTLTDAQRAAASKLREEEAAKKNVVVEDTNWSKEDIALLTKAIVRFPPGSARRWADIAEFCGNRKQKEVIKKAQELASRR